MAPILISLTAQALPVMIDYRVLVNNSGTDHQTLRGELKNRRPLNDRHPESPWTFKTETEHASFDLKYPTRETGAALLSSAGTNLSFTPAVDWRTPSLSFTPGTVSTASSPGSTGGTLDQPETPCRKSTTKSDNEVLMLLTQLTPPETGPIKDESCFQPKKLIRNMTLELQAIAEANTGAAKGNYSLTPSFDFTYDKHTINSITSRSNIQCPIKPPSVGLSITNSPTCNSRVRSPHTKLRQLLENILPFNLHARLKADPHQCVASLVTRPLEKCKYKVTTPSQSVDGIIKRISKYIKESNYPRVIKHITKLVQAVMCGVHQTSALSDTKDQPRQKQLRRLVSDDPPLSSEERSTFQQWLGAISYTSLTTEEAIGIDHTSPTTSKRTIKRTTTRPRSSGTAITSANTVKISSHLNFTPYHNKWTKYTISEALRKKITEPLLPSDLKQGYVYIFWDKGHFGKLKIGRTNDLEQRLRGWNRQCGREYVYHPNADGPVEIPHVRRIEDLIHIELKDSRLMRDCEGCLRKHIEWFRIDQTHADKVLKKWQGWILQKPYVIDPISKEWKLKPGMQERLDRICEPVQHEKHQQ